MKIIAATNNQNKLRELKQILEDMNFKVLSLNDVGLDIDIEETGTTFYENSLIKARYVSKITGEAVIADDSGLEVEALGGQPGVLSARYSGYTGEEKDKKNNEKLLNEMENIPDDKRNARFCCVIAAVLPNNREIVSEGYVYGKIGYDVNGSNGFGYDPLFIVDGYNKTMAELDASVKNKISHRGNALKDFALKLKKELNT